MAKRAFLGDVGVTPARSAAGAVVPPVHSVEPDADASAPAVADTTTTNRGTSVWTLCALARYV